MSKSKVTTTVETFTAEEAADLQNNHAGLNRPLSNGMVERFADAMLKGHWRLNGEAIVLDTEGNLIDGQHRLAACAKTGIPLTTIVVRGVETAAFDTIDQGRVRNLPQLLAIRGEENSHALSTLLRVIWEWERGWVGRAGRAGKFMTPADMFMLLDKHPDARKSVAEMTPYVSRSPFRGVAGNSIFAFAHYGAWQTSGNRHKADAFLEGIETGEGLLTGDARLTARNRLLREIGDREGHQAPRGYKNRLAPTALLIRAWNAYRVGKEVKELRLTIPEEMPEFYNEQAFWDRVGRKIATEPAEGEQAA